MQRRETGRILQAAGCHASCWPSSDETKYFDARRIVASATIVAKMSLQSRNRMRRCYWLSRARDSCIIVVVVSGSPFGVVHLECREQRDSARCEVTVLLDP